MSGRHPVETQIGAFVTMCGLGLISGLSLVTAVVTRKPAWVYLTGCSVANTMCYHELFLLACDVKTPLPECTP